MPLRPRSCHCELEVILNEGGDFMFGLESILGAIITMFQDLFVNGILGFITQLLGGLLPTG